MAEYLLIKVSLCNGTRQVESSVYIRHVSFGGIRVRRGKDPARWFISRDSRSLAGTPSDHGPVVIT